MTSSSELVIMDICHVPNFLITWHMLENNGNHQQSANKFEPDRELLAMLHSKKNRPLSQIWIMHSITHSTGYRTKIVLLVMVA